MNTKYYPPEEFYLTVIMSPLKRANELEFGSFIEIVYCSIICEKKIIMYRVHKRQNT